MSIFDSYKSEDEIDIEIISAAARTAMFLNKDDNALKAFLSPSNCVFVARQMYDQRRYRDCARVCVTALSSYRFISDAAKIEAVRLRCQSLARLGQEDDFRETISLLGDGSAYERAMLLFLEGFRLRMQGEPADAVAKLKNSHRLFKSYSTMRELSHSLMQIGEMEEATRLAEEALEFAPANPYIIDQALSLRVARRNRVTKDIIFDPEIENLLTNLERYGDDEGKSFYAIRMADIMRRAGAFDEALDFAKRAVSQTSALVPAHMIEAEILIKLKRLPAAAKKIDLIKKLIEDRQSGEGRARLPDYIFLKATYLIENNELGDAVSLLQAHERRLKRRIPELKRKICFLLGSGTHDLTAKQVQWLKEE
jgi:tetratricopeptide (TPR) repeat protein